MDRLTKLLNPIWKSLASHLASECEVCDRERLFSIFEFYSSKNYSSCNTCSLSSIILTPLIRYLFSYLDVDENTTQRLLEDSLIRNCMLNVVKGIKNFGIRNPQPTGTPITIVWNFTNKCNLKCLHCHQDSSPSSDNQELTTSQAFEVIDKLSKAGVVILTFSGGEPLVREDIFEVIKRAESKGLFCTIASNGILLTKEVAKKLADVGIRRVEIGLDGAKAETHDFLRNTEGSFEGAIRAVKNCAEVGFDEIATTMTLHSKNVDEVKETINLAEKLGATRFYLNRLIPAGRGMDASHLGVEDEGKIKSLKTLYRKFYYSVIQKNGIQCYARGMTYYSRLGYELSSGELFTVSEALSGHEKMFREKFGKELSKIVKKLAEGFGGCSAGLTYAGLTASGELIPCVPAPIELGNLLEQDLEKIWQEHQLLNYIRKRDELKGTCKRCEYNKICGGCRYTAYIATGDWLGPDPSCPFGPKLPTDINNTIR